ncbi:putative Leucine aminopeptidase 1 [Nannochloris sp. 'desiccata']|nr:putative Leucine aminopeptidase 1 [Chlorella desiccata (nom. nud.)]
MRQSLNSVARDGDASVCRPKALSTAVFAQSKRRQALANFAGQNFRTSPGRRREISVMTMAESQVRNYPYAPMDVAIQPEKIVSVALGSASASSWAGDLLVIGVFEDAFSTTDDKSSISSAELQALDAELGGALSDIVSVFDFKGKAGSSQAVRAGKNARFVALVGLGSADKATPSAEWGASVWQTFGGAVASTAKANKAKTAAVTIVGSLADDKKAAVAGRIANGIVNGAYESTRFKNKPTPSTLEAVELLFPSGAGADASIAHGVAMAKGALLTRYLVEAPPNVCTPTHLADAAAAIAAGAPDVMKLQVLEKEQCEALGMGLYLGVAEASDEPPKFIHLTYTPAGGSGSVKKKIGIVGKGLTFDSGGYNLKAGAGSMIEMMKFDMGGAGATLGAARAIADIKPANVEIHFIIASCENMVDARGLRPGDILVASNGKTVEVNNTDAEGRLTLADALLYAQNQCNVEAVVDIATLTGACMIALGDQIGALYSTTDEMASGFTSASKLAGEKLWRMPLEESYLEQLKSPVADYKNTGGRMGGSITAALFLKEFITDQDKTAWAHVDMAGPVWNDKAGGATGYGAGLLAEWAISQGK